MREMIIGVSVAVAAIGLVAEVISSRTPDPVVLEAPEGEPAVDAAPADAFVLDVSSIQTALAQIEPGEESDQIADWVVYGTLMHFGVDEDLLRDAMYDVAPIRDSALREVMNFQYGEGRRAVVGDDLWLFVSEFDEHPKATIGRLADQARMEAGELPAEVYLYTYRSDLARGEISVNRAGPLPSSQLIGREYGYVEAEVDDLESFAAWLSNVDDLTYARATERGVLLGGRRYSQDRTRSVSVDDVAALYQAHEHLEEAQARVESELEKIAAPYVEAWGRAVSAFNANVDLSNGRYSGILRWGEFDRALAEIRSLLGQRSQAPRSSSPKPTVEKPFGAGQDLEQVLRDLQRRDPFLGMAGDSVESRRMQLDSLETRVKTRLDELRRQRLEELREAGQIEPSEPGFSLDPQWDAAGLRTDLSRLVDSPARFLKVLLREARESTRELHPTAQSRIERASASFLELFAGSNIDAYTLSEELRPRVVAILDSTEGKTGRELENGALVPFFRLKERLKSEDRLAVLTALIDGTGAPDLRALRLLTILNQIESRRRAQCARYDGPLQGTRVGMNLFYTDLLAKLWESVDFYESAPLVQVAGFQSGPIVAPQIEPLYWEEMRRLPSTRLWFGSKPESFKGDPGAPAGLRFSHIATRVYAAGSNPLVPGEESPPAEDSRRTFGWWDQHFAAVAAYEQEYHLLNQIMKWSVLTGWLSEQDRFGFLRDVQVRRDLRFDSWLPAQESLQFRHPIPFLPEDAWLGETECLEILRSYTINFLGTDGYIEGGVSLGGKRSITAAMRVDRNLPLRLRRGALDYSVGAQNSGLGRELTTVGRNRFTLTRTSPGGAASRVKVAEAARLRAGSAEFAVDTVTNRFSLRGRSVELLAGEHSLGSLVGKVGKGRTSLRWQRGTLSADRDALGILKAAREGNGSVDLELLPRSNSYVFEGADGISVVRPGVGGSGSARVLRQVKGSPPDGSAQRVLRESLDSAGASRAGEFEIVSVPESEARSLVESATWQRLRPLVSQRSTHAGDVGRVFTDIPPPTSARPVDVELKSGGKAPLKGYVEDGMLWLERPSNAQGLDFANLVMREGIDSNALAKSLADGGKTVVLGREGWASFQVGEAAAAKSIKGDFSEAIALLRGSARNGELEHAIEGYLSQLRRSPVSEAARGHANAAAKRFAQVTAPSREIDGSATRVVKALKQGDALESERAINSLLARDLSPEQFERIAASLEDVAPEGISKLLRGRVNHSSAVATVRARAYGKRLLTELEAAADDVPRALRVEELRQVEDQVANGAAAEFWVRDQKILSHLDWDSAPRRSLAKLLDMEGIRVTALPGTNEFRPSLLLKQGKTYVRRDVPAFRGRVAGPARSAASSNTRILVESCDQNDDGIMDPDELGACGRKAG